MHLQNKIAIKWSPEFAYAIGLIVTDGGRAICFIQSSPPLVKIILIG